ncbi:MAG TPA: trypsin-like peptidase domain-containing protein, partial [Thermoanaerobaculia bacterium]|nr:trypsin-like peptidase domain-containing protein [Thermoanaerobaculia bacterium]
MEPASGPPRDLAIERALGVVYPALVNLSVVRERFVDGRAMRSKVAGSGVIVTSEGHLLTNHHVAADAVRIRATLSSGEQLEADVVAHDPPSDLSVLRLRAGPARRFAAATLGDSDALAVGQPVLALGNPFVLSSSVTLGIVSNPRRVFTDAAGSELVPVEPGGVAAGVLTPWIQHDALILPGSSGGPLVDLEGRVVGINELGGQGLGFAIPASAAADVLAQVLARNEVRRSWIGLTLLPAERRGRWEGALMAGVLPGSPAAAAGLRAGDILLQIGEMPVAARLFEEIPAIYRAVAALPSGVPVEIRFERDGEPGAVELVPRPLEPARGREGEIRRLGLTAQEITLPMVLERDLEGREGLLVTGVRPASPAARARPRLEPGDVLLAVGGEPVEGLDELARRIAARGEEPLPVELRRGRESILAIVPLVSREEGAWGAELPRAWLGVRTQVLAAELTGALGMTARGGFRITEVLPATAAARAGLRTGDLILSLDGEPLAARRLQESDDLRRALAGRAVGERVRLGLWRDGEALESEVELEAEPR